MPLSERNCSAFSSERQLLAMLREFAHHQAFDVRTRRFVIVRVGAVVADLRIGQDDDLAGIGRIGEDFLVAGDGGIEDDFARLSMGAPKLLPSKTVPSSRARIAEFNSDCPPVFSGRGVSHIEACWRARFNR